MDYGLWGVGVGGGCLYIHVTPNGRCVHGELRENLELTDTIYTIQKKRRIQNDLHIAGRFGFH
jgi:hypothetical protein